MSVQLDTAVETIAEKMAGALPNADRAELEKRVAKLVEQAGRDRTEADLIALISAWLSEFDLRLSGFNENADAAVADLSGWLLVRKRGSAGTRDAVAWFFEHYAAALTVLGLLATGFYGLAYATFYEAVDSSPEQVGLSTTQILAQSAVGGVGFVVFGGLLIAIMAAPYVPMIAALDVVEGYSDRWQLAGQVGLSLFSCAVVLSLQAAVGVLSAERAAITVAFLVLGPLLVSLRVSKHRHLHLAALHFKPSDFRATYLGSAAVALLVLGFLTFISANEAGERASEGERIRSPGIAGIPYLGLKAEPAFLTWRGDEPEHFKLPSCVLFLGHSDGSATVYDSQQRRTMRLPDDAVIVTIRQDRSSCAAPISKEKPVVERAPDGDLVCRRGDWSPYPHTGYTYLWIRDGIEREPRPENSYEFRPRDFNHSFRCAVEATTNLGSDIAYSHFFILPSARIAAAKAIAAPAAPRRGL